MFWIHLSQKKHLQFFNVLNYKKAETVKLSKKAQAKKAAEEEAKKAAEEAKKAAEAEAPAEETPAEA